ncbi:hypothetical protein GCM10018952_39010 [Streptosporangium vulgare]
MDAGRRKFTPPYAAGAGLARVRPRGPRPPRPRGRPPAVPNGVGNDVGQAPATHCPGGVGQAPARLDDAEAGAGAGTGSAEWPGGWDARPVGQGFLTRSRT